MQCQLTTVVWICSDIIEYKKERRRKRKKNPLMLSVHWSCLMETLIIPGILLFKIISLTAADVVPSSALFVVANLLQKNNKHMVLNNAQRRHINTISKTWITSGNLPDLVVNTRCINSTRDTFSTQGLYVSFCFRSLLLGEIKSET